MNSIFNPAQVCRKKDVSASLNFEDAILLVYIHCSGQEQKYRRLAYLLLPVLWSIILGPSRGPTKAQTFKHGDAFLGHSCGFLASPK
jgi:hypothetical protein